MTERKGITVANALTGVRIVCALGLIFCRTFSPWFWVFYTAGGISDVLDGIAARRTGKATKLGARLDTAADAAFTVTVIIKVLRAVPFPTWLLVWIIFIAAVKAVNAVVGLVIYKRFVSEHTVMNKICGVLVFLLPFYIGLLSPQSVTVPVTVVCAAATLAAAEEGYCIYTGKEIT